MSKVRVYVTPKREVLDPQGKAVARALGQMGFAGVKSVRVGRLLELELDKDATTPAASAELRQMCERLLANTVMEDFEIEAPNVTRGGK